MTVKELIQVLNMFDPLAEVHIQDFTGTTELESYMIYRTRPSNVTVKFTEAASIPMRYIGDEVIFDLTAIEEVRND